MAGQAQVTQHSLAWRKEKAEQLTGRVLEHRTFAAEIECRETEGATGDGMTLVGYASVTETPYEMSYYTETIRRGAFKRTLKEEPDVVLLLNHEGLPLARTKSGTLRLEEDEQGLRVEGDLDPLDAASQALARKLARGDLDGQMSFTFAPVEQTWSEDYTKRTLRAVSLHRGDVSVVTQGANPATSAEMRRLEGELAERGAATWDAYWRTTGEALSRTRTGTTERRTTPRNASAVETYERERIRQREVQAAKARSEDQLNRRDRLTSVPPTSGYEVRAAELRKQRRRRTAWR
jgi:HK97 family phage prohead protease